MLKITTVDQPHQQTLVVEGELVGPWIAELRRAWQSAHETNSRRIVVDLKNATLISEQGEELLREMKSEGAQFVCHGVFTRHVLRRLFRGCPKS